MKAILKRTLMELWPFTDKLLAIYMHFGDNLLHQAFFPALVLFCASTGPDGSDGKRRNYQQGQA